MIDVLVVDDDFRVAALHRAYVEHVDGFRVVGEAHSGSAALESVTRLRPDLVLLDIYLPDIPGLEVLRRLRASPAQQVDVIVVTAARDAASVEEALRNGSLYYLVKPFGPATLRERLAAYGQMRRRLASLAEASQAEVDEVYTALRTSAARELPKGHSPQTLGTIVETLRGAGPLGRGGRRRGRCEPCHGAALPVAPVAHRSCGARAPLRLGQARAPLPVAVSHAAVGATAHRPPVDL